jgi:hypothetical protein
MQEALINIPSGGVYEDSGEGGLFVMLVVPQPDDWGHNCHVDVNITLSSPDVCIGDQHRLWGEGRRDTVDAWRNQLKAQKALDEAGKGDLAIWALQARNPQDDSVPVLAAVHLGSTSESLWDEHKSRYWRAEKDNLTFAGFVLYARLQAAFGVEPLIMTFLDT